MKTNAARIKIPKRIPKKYRFIKPIIVIGKEIEHWGWMVQGPTGEWRQWCYWKRPKIVGCAVVITS